MSIIAILLPDFALIALGYALKRWASLGAEFWPQLEKLVYFLFFPALLFKALALAKIEFGSAAVLINTGLAATLVGMALAYCAKFLFRLQPVAYASAFQCGFRFNSYIGFAVLGRLHAETGIAAIALIQGVLVPVVNVAAVWALARHARSGVLQEIARNPLIIATVAGMAYNLTAMPLPGVAEHTLTLLAQAALPLGLIAVGASIRFDDAVTHKAYIAFITAVKLLAVPLAAWLIADAAGLTGAYRSAAIIFAALPASPTAFILAARMGGDGKLVAKILAVQIIAAAFTLPLWLSVIGL